MLVRKIFAGLVATTVAGTALALGASPASAAVDPDDTTFAPVTADLIGVGSDTSQRIVKNLAESWNAQTPAPASRVATYAATGGGTIDLPTADINRPNGSGAGKALLYGAGNNTDIDFARSSSGPSTAEVDAGLQFFPFALDTLKMAVSNSTPSHAPASLTAAQIVDIYDGTVTNWSELGGTSGTIVPLIPQAGSGTRSFFVAQLKAANGGVDVTLAGSVQEVQEHDDTPIKNNPDAVAPFSEARASLLGSTLRLETGFKADRALYNVVRGTSLGDANVQAVFGEDGFVCSTDARDEIEAAGFKQLATPDHGGACGAATQTATSNFTLNEAVVTSTALAAKSPQARTAKLVATVSGSTAPQGSVSFYEGDTLVQGSVPLVSGQATATVSDVDPGNHTYRAEFVPQGGSSFEASEDTDDVFVKTSASISESYPKAVPAGERAKGTITVTLAGIDLKATGKVTVKLGQKTVGQKELTNGKATIRLDKLPKGLNELKIVWPGDAHGAKKTKQFTINQK